MMNWRMQYYEGRVPLTEISGPGWNSLDVHTVQRVYVSAGEYTMIMQGHDFYWVDERNQEFGCFIGPHNYHIYEGSFGASFKLVGGRFISTGQKMPGDDVTILGSSYMPEQEAEQAGIL